MLVRSAGRRERRHTSRLLAASFAQLQLPWLAPAQLRWGNSQASSPYPSPRRSSHVTARRRSLSKSQPSSQLRQLATTTDQHPIHSDSSIYPPPGYSSGFRNATQDMHIPWDFSPNSSPLNRPKPIFLNTTTTTPASIIRVEHGIIGNARELLAHLHTSLSVGRLDRAAAIIQRMSAQSGSAAAELSYAHTAYLEHSSKSLRSYAARSEQSVALFQDMRKWFEVEVRAKDVRPTAKLLVTMIRAAIHALGESSCETPIRTYSDIANALGPDTLDDVVFSELYSDEEFTLVGKVTSDLFEDQVVEHDQEQEQEQDQHDIAMESQPSRTHDLFQQHQSLDLQSLPEVLATKQKGTGLSSIKRTMEAFTDLSEPSADASLDARRERAFAAQQQLEETSVEVALDRWRKADGDLKKLGINTAMQTKPISALMWQWYEALLPALERELAECKATLSPDKPGETDRHYYAPYLEMLSLPKVAANTILYTLSRMAAGRDYNTDMYESEVKLTTLTMGIAKILEQEHQAEISLQRSRPQRGHVANAKARNRLAAKRLLALKRKSKITTGRMQPRNSESSEKDTETLVQDIEADLEWPLAVRVKLGAMVVSKLMESAQLPVTREHPRTKAKITQMQPAFIHRMKYFHGKKLGMVVPNAALLEKIQSEPVASLIAKRMPMVVEPKPWQSWQDGGYLHHAMPIMRLPIGDKSGKDYFQAAHRKGNLGPLYGGLNALGKVPWRVNHDVFQVQLQAWNSGEEIANLAPLHPEFELPPEPDASAEPQSRHLWLEEVREIENRISGLHSKRCFQNFQLEVARSLVNETLYFPHNLDFRGRAYPIPPYLNHMGADNVRGLLTFAEGKQLGPDGLRWLKIHLATVAGFDKASLEERVEYTMSHLEDIYDSVRAPLEGRRWWLKAEDAWQLLAACFELTKALDSPDPTKFVSRLPVQQDGTCNGLQHYAALGGDRVGAAQVNLEPSSRPADVYTAVADAVKDEVRRDAENGNAIAQKLNGRITRKCVKQPVMTNVYGVTFFGARLQVRKQLETLFPEVKIHDAVNLGNMSHYIATKIFKCLGTMFSGAQAIQTWLGQCADRISTCMTPEQIAELTHGSKEKQAVSKRGRKPRPPPAGHVKNLWQASKPLFKSTVVWTTPLGLPVVQPYRASKARTVTTNMQSLSLQEPQVWDPVSKRKQLQAFPPNFIHSLDATHMLMSSLKCSEEGITFASIHDSFWTHACDVNTMSTLLRDAFVSMHSEDVIGRLREEFQARYKDCMYLASVRANSVIGEQIKKLRATRKFGKQSNELMIEVERLRLLNSQDDAERAEGAAEVTPGSLLASFKDESAFAPPTEMMGQALGEIPKNSTDGAHEDEALASIGSDDIMMEEETGAGVLATSESMGDSAAATAVDAEEDDKTSASQSASNIRDASRKIYVWLPMTFPEVPKKGDFDVRRLRESKYFFH